MVGSSVSAEEVTLAPIGVVHSERAEPIDDRWGQVRARIVLDPEILETDATAGLAHFSHLEVVYAFHRSTAVTRGARHPRGNESWPRVGILAQRGKDRPNHLGVSRCELVTAGKLELEVRGLDAIDGSPVLDVKPYATEFGPRGPVREPAWMRELMQEYF